MNSYDHESRILRQLVEIRPTSCQWGVFSRQAFLAGDLVGNVEGEIVEGEDYYSDYCMELDAHHSLEPRAPFRYLNHSCNPNCALVGDELLPEEDPRSAELVIEAIRDINPGDELTIDYAWPADTAIRCLCNANSCRGWIVDPSELHLLTSIA